MADAFGINYWLGREGVPTESFTIDLMSDVPIVDLLLCNTHNDPHNDRGTRDFRVYASSAVDGSNELVDPVLILDGRLPNVAGLNPIPSTVFTAANGLTPVNARYLKFESLSAYYDTNNMGLNEFEVYMTELHPPSEIPRENLAFRKPIIDGSSAWNGGTPGLCDGTGTTFDAGSYPANRVVDGSIADANTGRTSYWLAREGCENEYFTIDLEVPVKLDEIGLRNTHNNQSNDSGTGEFVTMVPTASMSLIIWLTLSWLSPVSWPTPQAKQSSPKRGSSSIRACRRFGT